MDLLLHPEWREQAVSAARSAQWFWLAHGWTRMRTGEMGWGTMRVINGAAMESGLPREARWIQVGQVLKV
ncbi:hypothetical protein FPJ27_37300 (plasmid) [Burkholderia sp. MS455]|uniref:hypothetical protein n=1 Tax=Burkholderia sp. MS455 TaxID=2811788 RepID=UPI00195A7CE3|nr:hypothetical protein [Burkholderia sp. MS455]QRR07641.1 hypothetical protein FPJ27_15355 [Burkholderia sp. MS455]QRR11854.1 hypothetical protein FPJ27_37300 [Burkholderia sp. MS455]